MHHLYLLSKLGEFVIDIASEVFTSLSLLFLPNIRTAWNRECLNTRGNEVYDVKRILRILAASELTLVVVVNEQTDGAIQNIRTTRETAGCSCQAGEIMTEFCIICFDRAGLRFAWRDLVMPVVVPERSIRGKRITEVPFGFWSFIDNLLESLGCAFPDNLPAQEAASSPIYVRDDVNSVFLSPINAAGFLLGSISAAT